MACRKKCLPRLSNIADNNTFVGTLFSYKNEIKSLAFGLQRSYIFKIIMSKSYVENRITGFGRLTFSSAKRNLRIKFTRYVGLPSRDIKAIRAANHPNNTRIWRKIYFIKT